MLNKLIKMLGQLLCNHVNNEVVLEYGSKRKYHHTNYDTEPYYEDIVEHTCYKCKKQEIIYKKRFI